VGYWDRAQIFMAKLQYPLQDIFWVMIKVLAQLRSAFQSTRMFLALYEANFDKL